MADITESFKRGDTLASDTNPRNSGTAARNYTCQKYGNDKGFISFGELNKDGAVTSGCSLHTNDGDHQMYMEIDGERKGCTTFVGPGSFNVVHGRDNNTDKDMSISLVAKDGNIFIKANDGDIIMEADNISLLARNNEGTKGNVVITATENISNNSKKFMVNAQASFNIVTSGKGFIIANSILNCYSSVLNFADDSAAVKDTKVASKRLVQESTTMS